MVLLIIIPMKNGYFIGNIPNIFRQTPMIFKDRSKTPQIYPRSSSTGPEKNFAQLPSSDVISSMAQPPRSGRTGMMLNEEELSQEEAVLKRLGNYYIIIYAHIKSY